MIPNSDDSGLEWRTFAYIMAYFGFLALIIVVASILALLGFG